MDSPWVANVYKKVLNFSILLSGQKYVLDNDSLHLYPSHCSVQSTFGLLSLLPPVAKFIVVQPKNMDYVLFPGKS